MSEFERCLEERRLLKMAVSSGMIEKELEAAKYDLTRAEESYRNKDFKWASVQAYYSLFHAAKALVLRKGYREKSHYCLLVALRELYVKTKELEPEFADIFEACMDARHEADYALVYDYESARITLENARRFFDMTQSLLDSKEN